MPGLVAVIAVKEKKKTIHKAIMTLHTRRIQERMDVIGGYTTLIITMKHYPEGTMCKLSIAIIYYTS